MKLRYALLALAAIVAGIAAAQQSITIPAQTITVIVPAQTITVPAASGSSSSGGTSSDSSGGTTAPAAPGGFTVYTNGVMSWQGDYSSPAPPIVVNYKDTAGKPTSGTYDISIDPKGGSWPVFTPYSNNVASNNYARSWSTTGYTALSFQLKPTGPGPFTLYFVLAGDEASTLPVVTLGANTAYGPVPAVGVWATYTVPLSALGVLNTNIYKFGLQNNLPNATSVFYVNNIRFL